MSQIAVRNNGPLREAHAVAYTTCGVRLRSPAQKGIPENTGRRDITPLGPRLHNRTQRDGDILPV
eukprot:IDg5639t1